MANLTPPDTRGPARLTSTFAAASATYIDPAVPFSHFRFRFDAAFGNNFPDRAEFFYPKCGCFGGDAPGPPEAESSVDYKEVQGYLELAIFNGTSVFVEAPVRLIDPEVNEEAGGLGDVNFGFKQALLKGEDAYLSCQLRVYVPTGEGERGLGTEHVSIEPALLGFLNLNDQTFLQGELRDWIPVGGTDFAGNVLRYGVGVSHIVYEMPGIRVLPVVELVGWSVLDGQKSRAGLPDAQDAAGEAIVNAKFSLRLSFGDSELPYLSSSGFGESSSLAIGYGRALTSDAWWYEDIFRVEYRISF